MTPDALKLWDESYVNVITHPARRGDWRNLTHWRWHVRLRDVDYGRLVRTKREAREVRRP